MTILEALIKLRDDLKLWCINNFNNKLNKNLGAEDYGRFLFVDENGDIDTSDIEISNITNLQAELDGKVSISRTINGKALSSDITLSASDVDTYSKTEIDNFVFITVDDIDVICNDLQVILPEQTFQVIYNDVQYTGGFIIPTVTSEEPIYTLNPNETYRVKVNGRTYEETVMGVDLGGGIQRTAIMNHDVFIMVTYTPDSSYESGGYWTYEYSVYVDPEEISISDGVNVIFETNRIVGADQNYVDGVYFIKKYGNETFTIGQTYSVTWDGVAYETQAANAGDYSGYSGSFIGNAKFLGGNDNGLPFAIISTTYEEGKGWAYTIIPEQPTSIRLGIYK